MHGRGERTNPGAGLQVAAGIRPVVEHLSAKLMPHDNIFRQIHNKRAAGFQRRLHHVVAMF